MPGIRSAKKHGLAGRNRRRSSVHPQSEDAASPPGPLQASVLVLNRFYMAVHVASVRRALRLLFCEMAEVIQLEQGPLQEAVFANYSFQSWREISLLRAKNKQRHEDWIRAVNFEFQVPRVIRLLRFDRLPKRKLNLTRRSLLARDDHLCQYCGRHFPTGRLTLDHVIPRSRGGKTTWENVVCACVDCNVRKGGRTPREAHMQLIRPPMRPRRNPMLMQKLNNPKYASWQTWLDGVAWDLGDRI